MRLKRIHVNQYIIRSNKKNGTNDPPITIRESGQTRRVNEVLILGPSKLVYRPDKPLSCGARIWIETKSNLIEK
jgi:hypothetical protein